MTLLNLPYRPCVGIVLFNQDGLVFVGERVNHKNSWQMPQGGIDEGEDIATAAFRELHEEVGTDKAEIIRIADKKIAYDFPQDGFWKGQYRGQEQTWVAMRFTGQDSDINLNTHHPAEFTKWQWIPLPQTVDLIVPFKRETYVQVVELFKNI